MESGIIERYGNGRERLGNGKKREGSWKGDGRRERWGVKECLI